MNLTSQLSRIVDNDSELISIYLHNAKSKREYFLTPYSVLLWEYKIRWLTEINSIHLWSHFLEKERSGRQLFLFLEGGLVGGKILESFSVTLQTSDTSTNSSCTILLWIGILWFIIRPICLSARSGCGLINAEALIGSYQNILLNY